MEPKSGWMPIGSAPKDGTHVLLRYGNDDNEIIEGWHRTQGKISFWDVVTLPHHGCGCCADIHGATPTHWRPLPN